MTLNHKIAIVDDDQVFAKTLKQFLEKARYPSTVFTSAEAFLADINHHTYTALMCDLLLPGMGGLDLCRKLKKSVETAHIKCFAMSSKPFSFDRNRALENGCEAFYTKPLHFAKFETELKEHLDKDSRQPVLTFWGVRGTLPVSGNQHTLYGSGTSCVSITDLCDSTIIFDAGSGIKLLGDELCKRTSNNINLFITHFHWDHINALPYFKPIYMPTTKLRILGPDCEETPINSILSTQMNNAFFPVSTGELAAQIEYQGLIAETVDLGEGVKVESIHLNHPGKCLGYKVIKDDFSICYMTDNEFFNKDSQYFSKHFYDQLVSFCSNTDMLIPDMTYHDDEYLTKVCWGHSSVTQVTDFSRACGAKNLYLFHHDPDQDDKSIQAKLEQTKKQLGDTVTQVFAPKEKQKITLDTFLQPNKTSGAA